MTIQDLTGRKFNRLLVIEYKGRNKHNKPIWLCRCDCGNEKDILGERLTSKIKSVKSCGCFGVESRFKHHKANTSIYHLWAGMIQRCTNIKNNRYKDYGGRGITVCDKWLTFEGFYEDMGDRPKDKSLDRIDNNKGYCKDNCKWSTNKEQSNNTRINHYLTYKNKTQTTQQWSEELGIKLCTLQARVNRNWSAERALGEVVAPYEKRKVSV